MRRTRVVVPAAVLVVSVIIGLGCQFLLFKCVVKNETPWKIKQFVVKSAGATEYPDCGLEVSPQGCAVLRGIKPGEYDLRATFDEDGVDTVFELFGVDMTLQSIAVTYMQYSGSGDPTNIAATINYMK